MQTISSHADALILTLTLNLTLTLTLTLIGGSFSDDITEVTQRIINIGNKDVPGFTVMTGMTVTISLNLNPNPSLSLSPTLTITIPITTTIIITPSLILTQTLTLVHDPGDLLCIETSRQSVPYLICSFHGDIQLELGLGLGKIRRS